MRKHPPIVLAVIIGLILIGMIGQVGGYVLVAMGKEVPESMGTSSTVASVVGALAAILSRTGHENNDKEKSDNGS